MSQYAGSNETLQAGKEKLLCVICSKVFVKKSNLQQHLGSAHNSTNPKPFGCDGCIVRMSSKINIANHIKKCLFGQSVPEHKRIAKFWCATCEKSFVKRKLLSRHMANVHQHFQADKIICALCQSQYTRSSSFAEHLGKQHSGMLNWKEFVCNHCGYSTKRRSCLKSHILINHLPQQPLMYCDICTNSYRRRQGITMHVCFSAALQSKKHEYEHICDLCEYRTTSKCKMQRHLKWVHLKTEERKRVQCPNCPKTSADKFKLKYHMASKHQMGKIEYLHCEKCNFRTLHKQNFLTHWKRTHTGRVEEPINPHFCDDCGAKVKNRQYIVRHIIKKHK